MKKIIYLLALLPIVLISNVCFAEVKVYTEDDQSLIKNTSTQIKDLKIVEDESNPQLTGSGIRIIIPDDLKIIWDTKYVSITAFGPAVTTGKVEPNPLVTYEKQGKIMVVPIKKPFSNSEEITFSQLYVKTFGDYSDSKYLGISNSNDNKIIATANKFIYIPNNDRLDNNEPGTPMNIKLEQISSTQVRLSWFDPYDLDVQSIEIYKGLGSEPIGSNKYANVEKGKQSFDDSGLKIGDKVRYILKATDGRNHSQISEEFSLTLVNLPSNSGTGVIINNTGSNLNTSSGSSVIITDSNGNIQNQTVLKYVSYTFGLKYSKTLNSFVKAMDSYINKNILSSYPIDKLNQIIGTRNEIINICYNIEKAKNKTELNLAISSLKKKVLELKSYLK